MSQDAKPLGHGFLVVLVVGLICWVTVAWVRRYYRMQAQKKVNLPAQVQEPKAGD